MSDLISAIILGIIQGLTEFLPVSSSGHIELGQAILNFDTFQTKLLHAIAISNDLQFYNHIHPFTEPQVNQPTKTKCYYTKQDKV